jgi:hypothetical protein
MPELQGLAYFPGIQQIRRASFTLSQGITPSSALIEIVPQSNIIAEIGTLTFSFGPLLLQFRDCRVNTASIRRTQGQGSVLSFQVRDRRWKWRYGKIIGRYNVRKRDETIDSQTEKTPQQLATLLLQAMNESRFDVSALPNRSRPEVSWDYDNPATELDKLVNSLGCRIVLGLDNRIRIRRVGIGRDLPGQDQMREGYGVMIPQRPDSLKLVGGPTRYQYKVLLEAVGEETDGSIKPIDDLSYKPSDGWEDVHHEDFHDIADNEKRQLALKTVYRLYRIKQQANLAGGGRNALNPPGYTGPDILKLKQLLPISSKLLDTFIVTHSETGETEEAERDAFVEGDYYDNVSNNILRDANVTGLKYPGSFSIDEDSGIVRFGRPVFKFNSDDQVVPATLYLTTISKIENATTRQLERYTRERRLPGQSQGTGPRILHQEEIVQWVKASYDRLTNVVQNVTSNINLDLNTQADYVLDAAQQELLQPESKELAYAGLKAIEPDGAIQQVSWQIGPGGATTQASLNSEFDFAVPSYKERQRQEFVQREIEEKHEERRRKKESRS